MPLDSDLLLESEEDRLHEECPREWLRLRGPDKGKEPFVMTNPSRWVKGESGNPAGRAWIPLSSTQELRRLYMDEGLTHEEIAAHLGCSKTRVRNAMLKYGIPSRPAGNRIFRGDIIALLQGPYGDRLRRRFRKHEGEPLSSGCREWQGSRNQAGYGRVIVGGKLLVAHRVGYAIHHGVLPIELEVCHHCDNPPCTEVSHLFLGTHQENMQDASQKGRLGKSGRHAS